MTTEVSTHAMPSQTPKRLTPEEFDIVNAYLTLETAQAVADTYKLDPHVVVEVLDRPDVKRYIDQVYLDQGYRNRSKLGKLLDAMIDSKIEEAEESGQYTSKDLFDLVSLAHKMNIDHAKLNPAGLAQGSQTNVQINNNYGTLLEKLMK